MVYERNPDLERPDDNEEYVFGWQKISEISEEEWALVVPEDMTEHVSDGERQSEEFVWVEPPKLVNINTPHMYRYMPQEYIDDFFQEGIISLSSFAEFSKHEDEIRRDSSEGQSILEGRGEEHTMLAVTGSGRSAYVLCGSTIGSDRLMERFSENGYFRIKYTTSLASELMNLMEENSEVRCKGILEEFCIYKEKRVIARETRIDFEDMKLDYSSGSVDMKKLLHKASKVGGNDVFFLKEKEYQEDCEYRILWIMENNVEGATFVECP